jgi:hypothetical protein
MDFLDDPAEMTPEQRLAEVAAILAGGYQRLRGQSANSLSDKGLDCPAAPGPPLAEGLTPREAAPTEVQA